MNNQQLADQEVQEMIDFINETIRAACIGQLSSVPLAFLVGGLSNSSLLSIATAITNPYTIGIFAGAGIAISWSKKVFQLIEEWRENREQEKATELIINQIWEAMETQQKQKPVSTKIVSFAKYHTKYQKNKNNNGHTR